MTWATNGMFDVTVSPKDLILTLGTAVILSLGPVRNMKRTVRVDSQVTWVAGSQLIPPNGVTTTVLAGWTGDWYGDETAGTWRCTNEMSASPTEMNALQSTFPANPQTGFVRDWYSSDGRRNRQSAEGRNRFYESPNAHVYRVLTQNNSRDFTQPPKNNQINSGTYNVLLNITPTFTGSYTIGTGQVLLTYASAPGVVVGNWINLSGLAGTGAFASLAGTWPVVAVNLGTNTVTVQATVGLAASAITSGSSAFANLITLTMAFANNFPVGAVATLNASNGTGAYLALNGQCQVQSVSGTTLNLQGPNGAGASTITAGTVSVPAFTSLFSANGLAPSATSPVIITNTNGYTQQIRQLISTTTANSQDIDWESNFPIYLAKSGRVTITWALDAVPPGNNRYFVGLKPSGPIGTTGNTTQFPNVIGVGINGGQTTLRQIHGDATGGTSTSTDLGSNYPANTTQDTYEFSAWWAASPTLVYWQLVRMTSAGVIFVTTGTFTTEIPDALTQLQLGIWGNNINSLAVLSFALMEAVYEVQS